MVLNMVIIRRIYFSYRTVTTKVNFASAAWNQDLASVWRFTKKLVKLGLLGALAVPLTSSVYWYAFSATEKQKLCLSDVKRQLPDILQGGAVRASRSAWSGLVISLDYKWNLRGVDEDSEEYSETLKSIHKRSAERILQACLRNTGLYIKFGQGMVAMNHVLPKEYCQTFKVLQDKCLRRQSEKEIDEMFVGDLGQSPDVLFAHFDREPIAAASLAEVFKATTHSGQKVAVKVQYMDLRERFNSDMATFAAILDMIEVMHPKFGFRWILTEVGDNMRQELDFLCEGRNSETCADDLRHIPFVHVPKVFWQLCSQRILTIEFIHATKISLKNDLLAAGYDVRVIDQRLIKIFAEQVFHTGFVHADPHAGNLLVRGPPNDPEIVLLDHGLYETLPEETRRPLALVWQAVVEKDYPAMKKYSNLLGVQDYRLFCMALTQRYIPYPPGEKPDFLAVFLAARGNDIKTLSRKEYRKLSTEDKAKIRVAMREAHDKMLDVFQDVPSKLMLIFRNLNIIRSIIRDHESGVDRHRIMARVAVRGFFVKRDFGLVGRVRGLLYLLMFDFRLLMDWAKMKAGSAVASVMRYFGFFSIDALL